MGRLLVLLSLLSFNAFAAQPGNAPVVCIGAPGQQTQSLCIPLSSLTGSGTDGVFSLYAAGGTANDAYILYKNGVQYQVTAGKTAYCFNFTADSSSASSGFMLVSATASFANGAASITGGVFQCAGALGNICMLTGPTANLQAPIPGTYTFGASTFPGFSPATSVSFRVHMDCFEK